jgi:hypothetical protein
MPDWKISNSLLLLLGLCFVGVLVASVLTFAIPFIAFVAEWRHVDWKPTLAWLNLTWSIPRTWDGVVQHLDLYFFKILPDMTKQRIKAQWLETKNFFSALYAMCLANLPGFVFAVIAVSLVTKVLQ